VNIQRWANIDGCMEPANDWGDWVKADEALARIAKLEAAIAELQEMVNVCEMDRNRALAELARLRPLAELYPLAWEECKEWREASNVMNAFDKHGWLILSRLAKGMRASNAFDAAIRRHIYARRQAGLVDDQAAKETP
jgi:hypothetical protein